jgi:hypothetical protein
MILSIVKKNWHKAKPVIALEKEEGGSLREHPSSFFVSAVYVFNLTLLGCFVVGLQTSSGLLSEGAAPIYGLCFLDGPTAVGKGDEQHDDGADTSAMRIR